jgi:hypothetical protein
MGLDNFWFKASTYEEGADNDCLELDVSGPIYGGMCSGHGSGSFRGKVYASLVEDLTGISLYEDLLHATQIQKIAKELEKHDSIPEDADNPYDIDQEGFDALKAMFRTYADHGDVLLASWY